MDKVEHHGTGDLDPHRPNGAVWPGSPIPAARPALVWAIPAVARRYSPSTSGPSSILTANLLAPFALQTAFPPSDYYEASAPPDGHQPTTNLPATALAGQQEGRPRVVPTFTTNRSTREMPSYTPAASPQVRRSLSSWPPHRFVHPGSGVARHVFIADAHGAPTQIHQVRVGSTLTGLHALVPLVHLLVSLAGPAPSGSADAPRRCQDCFPPSPASPGIRLSSASTRLLRQPSGKGIPPLLGHTGASWRTNRSSNRRPGSAAAQWCSLVCILNTLANDPSGTVSSGASVFTNASLAICSLLTARYRCRPSPCGRLSRSRTTTAAPPRPDSIGRRWTQPDRPRWRLTVRARVETVPVFTAIRWTKEEPDFVPVASPRLPRSTSPWPPAEPPMNRLGVPQHLPTLRAARWWVRATPGHIRQVHGRFGFEGLCDAGSSRTPLHHTCRTRTVWQCQHAPALSGLLPPSPAPPGSGCPQLHRLAATRTAAVVSHLRSNQQRLTAHRVEPEPALEGRGGLLLLRVAGHQRGVDVQHHHLAQIDAGDLRRRRLGQQTPHVTPDPCAGLLDSSQRGRAGLMQAPPHRRRRSDRTEQRRLVPQRVDVRDRLTTRGEHRGDVHPHLTPIMDRREPPPRQSCRQPLGEADSIRQQPDRHRASQRHHAITVGGD